MSFATLSWSILACLLLLSWGNYYLHYLREDKITRRHIIDATLIFANTGCDKRSPFSQIHCHAFPIQRCDEKLEMKDCLYLQRQTDTQSIKAALAKHRISRIKWISALCNGTADSVSQSNSCIYVLRAAHCLLSFRYAGARCLFLAFLRSRTCGLYTYERKALRSFSSVYIFFSRDPRVTMWRQKGKFWGD